MSGDEKGYAPTSGLFSRNGVSVTILNPERGKPTVRIDGMNGATILHVEDLLALADAVRSQFVAPARGS